jgi:hypothetical protein
MENLKGKLDVEFYLNVDEAQKLLREEMEKTAEAYDLKFTMEHAKASEKDIRLRTLCVYALLFYYKFSRVGILYVNEYCIREEIEKIEIPEEGYIKRLLEDAAGSSDKNISYGGKLALEPIDC